MGIWNQVDWPDEVPELRSGSAQPGTGDETNVARLPKAVLWLPNPDTQRGWEIMRIERSEAKAMPRRLGYGR